MKSTPTPFDHPVVQLAKLLDFHLLLPALLIFRLIHRQNPLFYHFTVETITIIIGVCIFLLYWNARRFVTEQFPLFLGISFLFISLIDLIHTFSHQGSPIFTGLSANEPTQLWISARLMESVCLLLALLWYHRQFKPLVLGAILTGITALVMLAIFRWRIFPACFVEGRGLTPFKIGAEYAICLFLVAAICLLWRRRSLFNKQVFTLLLASFLLTIISELAFTACIRVHDSTNQLGYFFKLVSFYYLYKALIQISLMQPFETLYRQIEDKELLRQAIAERFQGIADYTTNWEDWIGVDNRPQWVNRSAGLLTGYSVAECLAMADYPAGIVHPDDWDHFRTARDRVARDRIPLRDVPFRIRRKDGTEAWMSASWHPIYNQVQDYAGIRSSIRDITQTIQSERERNWLDERLKAQNDELESIIQIASHDLRSPLVNISGFFKELEHVIGEQDRLLAGGPVTQETQQTLRYAFGATIPEILGFIRPSIAKMFMILDGLLKMARLGRQPFEIETVDMNELIHNIVKSHSFQARNSQASFNLNPLPPCRADGSQLSNVFSNLIGNAIKYLDPDRMGIVTIEGSREGDRVRYHVIDNGIGIAPEHLDVIFSIFYRIDADKTEGEGLGLCAVRRILDRLDGRIAVTSQPGAGSRFTVELPAV